MNWNDIIGNENIKEMLIKTISQEKVLHSYLFQGLEGIGKKQFAYAFSKTIFCENKEKLCSNCKSCIQFESGNHPDFMYIEPEGKSIKIEQIRNMQINIAEKPILSRKKIYIIDNSDQMTKEAQNCLLKTLEEPPEYVVIILISSNPDNLLTTVRSRCSIITFKPISKEEIKKYMLEKYMKNLPENIYSLTDGSIGKAIFIMEKLEAFEKINTFIDKIENYDIIEAFKLAEVFYKEKEIIDNLLSMLNNLILEKAKLKKYIKYVNMVEYIEKAKTRIKASCNYDMCIDSLVLNIWEEIHEKCNRS